MFNADDDGTATLATSSQDLGVAGSECSVRDVWAGSDLGRVGGNFSASIAPHGVALLALKDCA